MTSFVETHALVWLVEDEAIAIVPVAIISIVTTGKKWQREISESTFASKTQLQVLFLCE